MKKSKKVARILIMAPNMVGLKDGINRIQPGHGMALIAGNLRKGGHEVELFVWCFLLLDLVSTKPILFLKLL